MSSSLIAAAAVSALLSHGGDESLESHRARILAHQDLTYSVEETLGLLEDFSSCKLGDFMIKNKGLNGKWTSYLILEAPEQDNLSPLEYWFVHKAPGVLATRARFQIFQDVMTARLKDNMRLASIPCGTMEDLLRLPVQEYEHISLVGIDLDQDSLIKAACNSQKYGIKKASFQAKDAWNLGEKEEFDLLTSNGLNIYECAPTRRIALYENFFNVLKPGGTLVTSFLTPPPTLNPASPWTNISLEDAKKQKALFMDIIDVKYLNYDMPEDITSQLESVGFTNIEILPDPQWIMPTIVATKP